MTPATDFPGYARAVGRPGIRNRLVVLSVCGLNAPGARKVAAALPGSVLISTPFGRGQVGPDKAFHDTMLERFGTHPNTGAVILLAADRAMRQRYQAAIQAAGRPVAGFSLQEEGEDGEILFDKAVAAGRDLQAVLDRQARVPCRVSDLVIAAECGHSDASSGIVANPLVGDLSDLVVAAGGAAVFSETLEWLGTEPGLCARCVSPEVADRLRELVAARHAIARAAGRDIRLGNPGPQNHEGGITTLEEKSLGAIAKGGTGPIAGALAQGEAIPGPGLYAMDTPTLSPESISSMVAGGAQLVCFTTGHGNPYGSALAPTVKVTANPETAARLPRQIDFDASPAFTGTAARADLAADFAALVLDVCAGRATAAERADEGDEVISRQGPSI
ncbi:MAG: UxaA family hydrolase [Rhodobiaceae bacterium]|nr:UxaA family hydrolase [Rhodobiaceae bacterium]